MGDNRPDPALQVLLVISGMQSGGAERQMADMANYWAARDLRVTLATWTPRATADFYPLDARVVRIALEPPTARGLAARTRTNLARIRRLRRVLATLRPKAAVSFMTESNLLTIMAASGLGIRVVISERVQPRMHAAFPWQWRALRRALYRRATAVVAQTRAAADWLERACRTPVTVIPNALRGMPERSPQPSALIVAVGRLTRQKGFDLLLRAFAAICGGFPEWRVAVVGEGEERTQLEQLRRELRLEQRVEFAGASDDVPGWMARAALVVQPSRFEGFPNVVLEAMGMGLAVISTDCPSGPAEMISDQVNGRLVAVEDVAALARVMAELMSSPAERGRLGRCALGVRERYHQDRVMQEWEACVFGQLQPAAGRGAH